VILAAGTPQVLLPYDNASQFVHNLSQHKGLLATWTAWTVPRTMRPAEAAKQVGMSEATLRDINRIPPKMLVKAGSTLLVPRSQHREQDVSETVADNAMMALAPDLPPLRRMSLRAGKNDSVASLARRYRVSAEQVAQWNRVSASSKFKRGQSVVVYVPAGKKVQKSTRTLARATSKATVKVASASRTGNRAVKGRAAPSRASRVRVASAR
jgi:membrane-bound lytic murein transglycosylase D